MRVALLRACKAERPPKRLSATDISLLLAKHTDSLLCGPNIPCFGEHCCISRSCTVGGMHSRRPLRAILPSPCLQQRPLKARVTFGGSWWPATVFCSSLPNCPTSHLKSTCKILCGARSFLQLPCTPPPTKPSVTGPRRPPLSQAVLLSVVLRPGLPSCPIGNCQGAYFHSTACAHVTSSRTHWRTECSTDCLGALGAQAPICHAGVLVLRMCCAEQRATRTQRRLGCSCANAKNCMQLGKGFGGRASRCGDQHRQSHPPPSEKPAVTL